MGTLVRELGPAWGPLIVPDLDPDARYVFTVYLVSVDARVRGGERADVIVRRLGGTIGECTVVEETDELEFRAGERYLLFLHQRGETLEDGTPRYSILGAAQGIWAINTDGVLGGGAESIARDRSKASFPDVADRIVTELRHSSPRSVAEVSPDLLVPFSESPVGDEPPDLPSAARQQLGYDVAVYGTSVKVIFMRASSWPAGLAAWSRR